MGPLTWEDCYEGFYDWAPSTRKNYARRLTGFGPADEVLELAAEMDRQDGTWFLQRALDAGVRFTPAQVRETGLDPGITGRRPTAVFSKKCLTSVPLCAIIIEHPKTGCSYIAG